MQATLTAFSPVNPVWLDLVLSRDGEDFEFTPAIRDLRSSSGCRPMTAHTCRHCRADPGRAYDLGLSPFEQFCGLKAQAGRSDSDLPTFCSSQYWPWNLCPHYTPR